MNHILDKLVISRVYSATTMYSATNTSSRRVNRPTWAIIIKYEGETVYQAYGKEYISNRNNLVILPKGSCYSWICKKAGHYAAIEFESNLHCNDLLTFPVSDCDIILSKFRELESKRLLQHTMVELESIHDVYAIILKILSLSPKASAPLRKANKLAPAIEHISMHYMEDITNDLLAQLTHLSTVYFRKLFKEVYHTSPINYVKEIRITKAKEMLRSDFGSISEVGLSLGYPNIYDFSRDFKKHVGLSPRSYIRMYQEDSFNH